MESQNSLFSLSHTSTPKNSHTSTPKNSHTSTSLALTTLPPADDDGDADDEETDAGDGADVDGQIVEEAMENIEDKSPICAKEDEVMGGCSMAKTGEFLLLSHSHGLGEGKGGFLVGRNVDFHVGSSSPKLGFHAASEDEKSLKEDETTPAVLAMANDGDRIPNGKGDYPLTKDTILATSDENTMRQQKLGLFNESLSSFSGGRVEKPFPMAEFLRLANAVVDDGDEDSKKALMELKRRWEEWIGVETSRRRITLLRPEDESPLIMGAKFAFFPAETSVNEALPSVGRKTELGLVLRRPATVADVEGVAVLDADVEKCVEVEDGMEDEMSHDISLKPGDVTTAQPADVTADITADSANVSSDVTLDICKNTTTHSFANRTSRGLFIGNIPLHTCGNSEVDDKIAQVFNNSSRKTLSYIAPIMQNGEVVVRPSLDTVHDGAKRWKTIAVGYFLGKRSYFHHLKEYAQSVWAALREVTATTNGFFFFQFKTVIDMEEMIEGGPWLSQGQPIILQKWESGIAMRKLKHT
ncbi:UNVERIFIED_CONTAM: hypothetical protein Sindi_1272400 [Sesamum indicum]